MIYFFGGEAQVFRFYAWQRGHVHVIREVSLKIPKKQQVEFFLAPHTVSLPIQDPGPGTLAPTEKRRCGKNTPQRQDTPYLKSSGISF